MLGGGKPLTDPNPVISRQFSKPIVDCSKRHCNRQTAGQCSDVQIITHLINYVRINTLHRRLRCSHGNNKPCQSATVFPKTNNHAGVTHEF